MKTSIFVIALIIVVFMAGALMLSIVYEKRSEKQRTSKITSKPFVAMPVVYVAYTEEVKTPFCKPIVMDLCLSNKHPF